MSDEPLYCTVCGEENCSVHWQQETVGPYCEVCGVIPAAEGGRCRQNGGTRNYCITEEEKKRNG